MKKDIIKNLPTKTVLLCEQCGKHGLEEEMEKIFVEIIKHKSCELNVTKEQTYSKPTITTPAVETPKIITGNEESSLPGQSKAPVREIVPPGIKKNDPKFLRPSVVGPAGFKVPTMADMMKEPGT